MGSFQPVDLECRTVLARYLGFYPDNEGSECNFSNLFIWGQAQNIRWKIEADCLLLQVEVKNSQPCLLMAFAAPERMETALETAVRTMTEQGLPFKMTCLPEWYCEIMRRWFPGRFRFEREPYLDDYIYRASDLITLRGNKYHKKRNHINKFLSRYADRYSYESFSPSLCDDCMEVYKQWLAGQSAPEALREEYFSVQRALNNAEALGLVGGVIKVDGEVGAFCLGERLTRDMALIHVEKAKLEIPELFTMINREFVAHAFSDLLWINREEDMGDEGLRKAKRSYHPARMVEKYSAVLSGEG